MYRTSGSFGKSRFRIHSALTAVCAWSRLIAQRAVAIATRYSSCLSVKREIDLFNIGSASTQCPFAVRSIARSTEDVATGGAFSAGRAARKLAPRNAARGGRNITRNILLLAPAKV